MKSKTLDALCKAEAGTFGKFVQKKEAHLRALENERKERIRASRKAAQELSWAA